MKALLLAMALLASGAGAQTASGPRMDWPLGAVPIPPGTIMYSAGDTVSIVGTDATTHPVRLPKNLEKFSQEDIQAWVKAWVEFMGPKQKYEAAVDALDAKYKDVAANDHPTGAVWQSVELPPSDKTGVYGDTHSNPVTWGVWVDNPNAGKRIRGPLLPW